MPVEMEDNNSGAATNVLIQNIMRGKLLAGCPFMVGL